MAPRNSIVLWRDLQQITDVVCKHFGLSYRKLLPDTSLRARRYGECRPCERCSNSPYVDEGNCKEKLIYIRTHQLNNPAAPLAFSTILDTLTHELAHLREWNHGKKHKEFQREIEDYLLELGYEVK